jgi:hypothetical protein
MMLTVQRRRSFANGFVYALKTIDGYPIEVTDTFLPYYTKDAVGRKQNTLKTYDLGSREDRWMIGVSCMSGCPVRCKFCATGKLKRCRNLTAKEITEQVDFVVKHTSDSQNILRAKEFKINYTRMGEPFMNVGNVRAAIASIDKMVGLRRMASGQDPVHHYVSTIGVKGFDFSWVESHITLQISLHSLDEKRRDWLIPYKNKMTIEELGQIRTNSYLKTTVNLTLVDKEDFDIDVLHRYFDPKYFFIKLSPINPNDVSDSYDMGTGVVESLNLI